MTVIKNRIERTFKRVWKNKINLTNKDKIKHINRTRRKNNEKN